MLCSEGRGVLSGLPAGVVLMGRISGGDSVMLPPSSTGSSAWPLRSDSSVLLIMRLVSSPMSGRLLASPPDCCSARIDCIESIDIMVNSSAANIVS